MICNEEFCIECGRELVTKTGGIYRYDGKTGKPLYHLYKQCPKWRWWNPLHDRHHGLHHPDGNVTWFTTVV